MEEVMMMMISSSPDSPMNGKTISQEPITTTTCPTWKLYENPFYNSPHHQHHQDHHHHQQQQLQSKKHLHHLHLPLSARKVAASFWDLTFFSPIMAPELDIAHAQINELRAELEHERKARKKVESMNKRLAKELAEEKRGREAVERVCEELAREISLDKAEIDRMKREMEEERKMLRMAEVLREERVQMKLAEAKILLEEKLLELEVSTPKMEQKNHEEDKVPGIATASKAAAACLSGKFTKLVIENKSCDDNSVTDLSEKSSSSVHDNTGNLGSMGILRKASPEPENPHIKRGIKGFVEFPRVVRAMGSKSRHWGTKLECQRAQLRILLKQKCPIRSNSLILS